MARRGRVLAGAIAGGLPVLAFTSTAGAEQHTVTVTLLGGQTITITIDVPAGTPLDQVRLPDIATPVVSVSSAPPAPGADPSGGAAPAKQDATRPQRSTHRPKRARHARPAPATVATPPAHTRTPSHRRARRGALADGTPTRANPTFSYALPGPAPVGVPNFFIDRLRIPPFLLPIYQAAGIQYGIRWEVLAAINEVETDYGRNLNVSSAGAVGWMQFLPSTWKRYGVDANGDGRRDPYNPVDAIFGAARYLKAAGGQQDVRKAIFAYNHADWYVDSVLMRARLIGGTPADLIGSLTGLTEGRFPVDAPSRYAGAADKAHVNVFARPGSQVIAVQDGRIVRMGRSAKLGRYVVLRDAYGNTYTYAGLRSVARRHAVIRDRRSVADAALRQLDLPAKDVVPTTAATAGRQVAARLARHVTVTKERLFAHPPDGTDAVAARAPKGVAKYLAVGGLRRDQIRVVGLRAGSRVIAGTVLGRLGVTHRGIASHLNFRIRPAGRDAPQIDPKPILDGWKLLEATAIYRAVGRNPFFGPDARNPSIGQIMLLGKAALQRRVLTDPDITISSAGRDDVRSGQIDRRVLATLAFLSASGLKPTVSCLKTGHGYLTSSGNVSEHSSGNAADISAINGIPVAGHQGPGSITDITIRRLLTLQGVMKPHQIISLMTFAGTDNTLALPDHADHIHVGFRPLYDPRTPGSARHLDAVLKPGQWATLIRRLGTIRNPTLPGPGGSDG